jgi:lipid A 3-O-deacylase
MLPIHSKLFAAAFLFAVCHQVNADALDGVLADYKQVSEQGKVTHQLDIDNDTLLFNKNDGFYTSGLRYTQLRALGNGSSSTTFGWRLGQELYTASDIKLPPERVGPPDHPYAGWLYGGFFRQIERADGTHVKLGIDIGCLGPCAGGKWTQTNFHRLISQPLPQGWSKQVRNEVGAVLYADVAPVRWTPGRMVDITPSLNGRFGNIFTDVGAGVTIRAGRLEMSPDHASFHGFLRTDLHAVGYNATLQGGYFSHGNPHTVAPKRIVGEAEAGVVWNDGEYGVKLAIVRRSNEIRDLANSIGAQNYVHLLFSYTP